MADGKITILEKRPSWHKLAPLLLIRFGEFFARPIFLRIHPVSRLVQLKTNVRIRILSIGLGGSKERNEKNAAEKIAIERDHGWYNFFCVAVAKYLPYVFSRLQSESHGARIQTWASGRRKNRKACR